MSVIVERIPDQPIIILHYKGFLTMDDFQSAFAQSAAMAADIEGVVYRISDIREADTNFVEIANILKASRANAHGTAIDTKFRVMFVGQNQLANMYTDALKQIGAAPIPFFKTLEDALEVIEVERQKQTN